MPLILPDRKPALVSCLDSLMCWSKHCKWSRMQLPMVTRTRKYDHILPILRQLHWLPIKRRIVFKIILLTYKALNGLAPGYIADIFELHSQAGSLRSVRKYLLSVPRTIVNNCGDRAISVAVPRLWNPLPMHIKMSNSVPIFVNKRLKTFTFLNASVCKLLFLLFV